MIRPQVPNTGVIINLFQRWAYKFFLLVWKSPIRKFLGPFPNRKSANFLGVPVRKSQIRKLGKEKGSVSEPDILDYEMQCNSVSKLCQSQIRP
jgi:hypothetical protein